MHSISQPFPQFFDLDGTPLDGGLLYFGPENLNPETNPSTVYWDAAGATPAAQPVKTTSGLITRNGTPAQLFVNGTYSLIVRNKKGKLVYYKQSNSENEFVTNNVMGIVTGLDKTGTIDCADALTAQDVSAPVTLTAGTYRISKNVTFTKTILFRPGAKLSIDGGATVTFNKKLVAPPGEQVFYGAGSVANLKKNRVVWFAGDKLDTTTDAFSDIQKCYDATATSGKVSWGEGAYTISGASPILVKKGQRTVGSGKFSSKLIYNTSACYGFRVQDSIGAGFSGMTVGKDSQLLLPTSGIALDVAASYCEIEDFLVNGGFHGIVTSNSGGAFKAERFDVLDCFEIGIYCHDVNDVFFNQFTIVAIFDRLQLTNVTGTFTTSDVLIGGTSGSLGAVGEVLTSSLLRVHASTKNFSIGETVTGSVSGATGVVVSQVVPHRLGGIRFYNKVEAAILTDGDVIGGQYSLTTDATSYSTGVRPAYNKFNQVYFDSADNGVSLQNLVEHDFISCWFSNRPNNGVIIDQCENVRFTGGGAVNCAKAGLVLGALSKFTYFTNFACFGNSTEAANTYDGVQVQPDTTDFHFMNCRSGGTTGGFGTQRWGMGINTGASDRFSIIGCDLNFNGTGGLADSSSGSDKQIGGNFGYKSRNRGIGKVTGGTNNVVVNHGLPNVPAADSITITTLSATGSNPMYIDSTSINGTSFTVRTAVNAAGDFFFQWQATTVGGF